MQKSGGSVDEFIAAVTPAVRRRDAERLVGLMREVSGREPELWGTIVGFGTCHYRYPTGTEGEMPVLAFAPRKASMTIYLDSAAKHAQALADFGPHTTGASCLYIKDLAATDEGVLRDILYRVQDFVDAGGDENARLTVTD